MKYKHTLSWTVIWSDDFDFKLVFCTILDVSLHQRNSDTEHISVDMGTWKDKNGPTKASSMRCSSSSKFGENSGTGITCIINLRVYHIQMGNTFLRYRMSDYLVWWTFQESILRSDSHLINDVFTSYTSDITCSTFSFINKT